MKLFVINGKINPNLHDPTWQWLTLNPMTGWATQQQLQPSLCFLFKIWSQEGGKHFNNSSSHCVYLILTGCLNSESLQHDCGSSVKRLKCSFTLTAEWRGCCLLLLDLKEWMVSVLVAEMQYPPVLLCVVFLRSALEDFLCLWSQPQEAKRTLLAAWRELPTTGRTSLVWCAGRRWTPPAL